MARLFAPEATLKEVSERFPAEVVVERVVPEIESVVTKTRKVRRHNRRVGKTRASAAAGFRREYNSSRFPTRKSRAPVLPSVPVAISCRFHVIFSPPA
jgi:hypothetical protein